MNIQKRVNRIVKEKGKMKRWHKLVTALACVVVFCTTYALILPAVTMERETFCGYTEHTHTDACYSQVLTCDQEQGNGHVHTEDCYDDEDALVCGMEEGEGSHTHTDACYEKQLSCGLEEHSHVLSCYSNPHMDVEEAADWEQTMDDIELTDDLRANVAAVAQSQLGYKESKKNYTVMEDGETLKGYTRYGEWYGEPYADWDGMFVDFCLYYAGVSEEDMPTAHDCADWIKVLDDNKLYMSPDGYDPQVGDLVFIDTDPDDDQDGPDHVALISEVKYDKDNDLEKIRTVEGDPELGKVESGSYKAGDDHVYAYGILNVKEPNEMVAAAFEEETESAAQTETETVSETETETEIETETELDDTTVIGTLTAEGDDYTVTVDYTAAAQFPEDVVLTVNEITKGKELDQYKEQSEELLDVDLSEDQTDARFFDITFTDADGNEIKPEAGVRVNISVAQSPADVSDVQVVHFGDEAETVECTAEGEDELNVAFEADQFSVYGVVYTVDFHWEVDGKTYDFSIPGGGFVSFTDLVEVLGIIGNTNNEEDGVEMDTDEAQTADGMFDAVAGDAAKKFVADVEKVEFSSPELVDVSKVESDTTVGQIKENRGLTCEYSADMTEEQIAEINAQTVKAGDWALISVKPFISKENLTVTMKNGDLFTIQVTDGQIHTYAISDSGDTYKITVTYDDATGIPADAELQVRQLTPDDERYQKDIERSNTALLAEWDQEAANPVIFEIKIIANGKEIEPIEGTQVGVEISLAMDAINGKSQEEAGENAELEEKGCMLIDGLEYTVDPDEVDPTSARVVHLTDDGEAVVIEDLNSMVDVDNNMVLNFATESFSDYTISGVNNNYGLNGLPDTIYVGDEIYMQNCSDMWVTGIGSVVTETKYNNLDSYKSVRATSPGTFRICHKNDWNNGATGYTNQYAGKYITILPARSEGNNGQPYPGTTPPATIETIDNASIGLKLNLFDYDLDDYLDNRFNNQDYGSSALGAFTGHGINSGHSLKFWGSGITSYDYGYYNRYVEHGVTSIVNNTTDTGKAGGYPVLKDGDKKSLDYLFTPSDGTDKKAYTNVNGLFKKDGDYYVYDSDQNYAWYNPDTNRFEVYNGTYKQKLRGDGGEQASQVSTKNIGFFPFHEWDDQYDLFVNWNKNLNHHFGMSMSVDFSLPKDPKAVKDSSGNPIIFEFSGDDDLWVFIDGKLVMDIGGIHQPTSGTINFQTGVVTVNGNTQLNNSAFNQRFPDLYDGKKHTMQVFYIERGGCDSNCRIQFNLTQYGNVECDKADADDLTTLLPDAVFGLFKDENCTEPLMENLKNGSSRAFIAKSDANGHVKFEDIPLGTYYMKEIESPAGYPIDKTVHPVRIFLSETGTVKVKVTIDGEEVSAGVKIKNKKPEPIDLGLKKEWRNMDGGAVQVPEGTKAKFELKRFRTHEEFTDTPVPSEQSVSKLVVGWVHNGKTHNYKEYMFLSGSNATVSWGYVNGYTGNKACIVNGENVDKNYVGSNIISQAVTMPGEGQTASLYIVDDSDNGEAISGINVSGPEYIGTSQGGFIREYKIITEPDGSFQYTGDSNVVNNQIELPVNDGWEYMFNDLPVFSKVGDTTYTYTYYLEEISTENPSETTVVYKDSDGNVINTASDAETSESGIQTIINKISEQEVVLKKIGVNNTDQTQTRSFLGGAKFTIYYAAGKDKDQKGSVARDSGGRKLENLVSDGQTGIFWSGRLLPGDYMIEETEAPDGYVKSSVLVKMIVNKDGISLGHVGTVGTAPYSQPVKEGNVWTLEFMNTAGASLPSTGGPGTSVIWLSGLVLAGLAGAGLLLERRRNKKTA